MRHGRTPLLVFLLIGACSSSGAGNGGPATGGASGGGDGAGGLFGGQRPRGSAPTGEDVDSAVVGSGGGGGTAARDAAAGSTGGAGGSGTGGSPTGSGGGGAGGMPAGSGGATAGRDGGGAGGGSVGLDGGGRDVAADASRPADSQRPADVVVSEAPALCGAGGTCASIEAEYAATFKQAVSCASMMGNACQQKAPTSLGCGCEAWVNSKGDLDRVRSKWESAGCRSCVRVCPAIACLDLNNGQCGPNGTCVDRGP